ncbi:MAG: sigma-54 dependent transcriptional regulator [Bacteroidota bacterium]
MEKEKSNILLVEDDADFRELIKRNFGRWYRIIPAPNLDVAAKAIKVNSNFDLILLDLSFDVGEDLEGLQHIQIFKSLTPKTPIIVVTKDQKSSTVIRAMRNGADNYVRKDELDINEWRVLFDQYLDQSTVDVEEKGSKDKEHTFIGENQAIIKLKSQLRKLSEIPDVTVLITGETGVGKEVAARYLHQFGIRKDKPFKAVNLSVIPDSLIESTLFGHRKGAFTDAKGNYKGAFEEAQGGILFLDEIGEVNHSIQVKLLRFLEDKKITPVGGQEIQLDVQIVTATNRDLSKEIDGNNFRSDLYYRLNQFNIHIPPLRERKDDLRLLLKHYLEKNDLTKEHLSASAQQKLLNFNWPGNVRQLVNTLKQCTVKLKVNDQEKITDDLLPIEIQRFEFQDDPKVAINNISSLNAEEQKAVIDLTEIEQALANNKNKGEAAKALNLNLDKLKYKIEKYYKAYPGLFNKFPTISQKYKLQNDEK